MKQKSVVGIVIFGYGRPECIYFSVFLILLWLSSFKQNNAFEFVELKDFKISEKFSPQELGKLAVNA